MTAEERKKAEYEAIINAANEAFLRGVTKYAEDVEKGEVEGIHDIAPVDPEKADDHLK